MTPFTKPRGAALLACGIATLAVAACNKAGAPGHAITSTAAENTVGSADQGNTVAAADLGAPAGALPPVAGSGTPVADAPAAQALPAAPAAPVAAPPPPQDQYRYVGQAQALGAAFADSPPDYAVDYAGTRPWIWRAGDGAYRVAEPVPGGMRYYYYEPGQATPFFVEDPRYGYGFESGRLTVVYDAFGRPLPPSAEGVQAQWAGRYLARAEALYQAALHERREAAYEASWQARRNLILQQQQQWQAAQQRNAQWRAWGKAHADQQQMWRQEQAQRQAYAVRLTEAQRSGLLQGARAARAQDEAQRQGAAIAAARQQQSTAEQAVAQRNAQAQSREAAVTAARQQQAAADKDRQARLDQQAAQRQAGVAAAKQRVADVAQAQKAKAEAARKAKARAKQDRTKATGQTPQ
jgi:hypothetical protein